MPGMDRTLNVVMAPRMPDDYRPYRVDDDMKIDQGAPRKPWWQALKPLKLAGALPHRRLTKTAHP